MLYRRLRSVISHHRLSLVLYCACMFVRCLASRENTNMDLWNYGQTVTMPDSGFDGVSSSLPEFMYLFTFPTFFSTFFVLCPRNPDTTHNRQHTSSAGCVLQPAGHNAIHACCLRAEQEATPHACGSLSAPYCCGFLVAFVIGPCDL